MSMKITDHKYIRNLCLGLLVVAILSIAACTNGDRDGSPDANGTMNIDIGEDGMIRNGTEYDTYQLQEGQRGIISIRITKVSGQLNIDICPVGSKGTPNYTGRDIDSATFDVIVEESGEYQVCFTATEFVGDYEISWRTEECGGLP